MSNYTDPRPSGTGPERDLPDLEQLGATWEQDAGMVEVPCMRCRGTCEVDGADCLECEGWGSILVASR